MDILYDYRKAAAFERTYTLEGRPIRNRRIVVNPPAPSQEEIQEAFRIVRGDEEMGRILDSVFGAAGRRLPDRGRPRQSLRTGARCLLIQILSPDRMGSFAWWASTS